MKTAAFVTLGCKLNQYETEAIREEVLALGYRETDASLPADVYVVNSCAVTAASATASRKAVERAARVNPAARIVVVGCSTGPERDRLARLPQVTVLAGTEEKALVADLLEGGWRPGDLERRPERDVFSLSVSRFEGRTRAIVKVQDGCDVFCSFCIIPFLRGRSRSRRPESVVEEVERLAAGGFREVVVTGVHLQDYGLDLGVSLPELLCRVSDVRGIERVRLSSLGPAAFTPALIDVLDRPVFCPHWHIPLQSGSDAVLRRMRRGYSLGDFRRAVGALRARFGEVTITTDVIAGHPGEGPREFEETAAACRELRFAKLHVFPFSVREGTLASKLGGHVDPLEVRRRARVLMSLSDRLALEHAEGFVGRVLDDVLVEGRTFPAGGRLEDLPDLEGTTRHGLKVRFGAPSATAAGRLRGTIQAVRVMAAEPGLVRGVWAGEVAAA